MSPWYSCMSVVFLHALRSEDSGRLRLLRRQHLLPASCRTPMLGVLLCSKYCTAATGVLRTHMVARLEATHKLYIFVAKLWNHLLPCQSMLTDAAFTYVVCDFHMKCGVSDVTLAHRSLTSSPLFFALSPRALPSSHSPLSPSLCFFPCGVGQDVPFFFALSSLPSSHSPFSSPFFFACGVGRLHRSSAVSA